jgi:hypothetical protein
MFGHPQANFPGIDLSKANNMPRPPFHNPADRIQVIAKLAVKVEPVMVRVANQSGQPVRKVLAKLHIQPRFISYHKGIRESQFGRPLV